MIDNNSKDLMKHYFWGGFDAGVMFMFLSFDIWDKTQNMITVAIAFVIPIIIDTIINYFFSGISDQSAGGIKVIITGTSLWASGSSLRWYRLSLIFTHLTA